MSNEVPERKVSFTFNTTLMVAVWTFALGLELVAISRAVEEAGREVAGAVRESAEGCR